MSQGVIVIENLLRNFPHCAEFSDDSFLGIYHEQQLWNEEEYWKLDKAIYQLAEKHNGKDIPRSIAWPIMRIFSYLMMSIQAHDDSNDGFKILNVDSDSLFNWRERFQLVVEGFFSGKMPANDIFEYQNPLLSKDT